MLHKTKLSDFPQLASSQFMKWQNLGITMLKRAICVPNVFLKTATKPKNYQFYLPNFLKFCDNISHKLLRPSQFLEKVLEILESFTLEQYITPLPILKVAVYWKSSNTKACARKLSQIIANNIGNRGRGISLKIYVRYCNYELRICLKY